MKVRKSSKRKVATSSSPKNDEGVKRDDATLVALKEAATALPSSDLAPLRQLASWVGDKEFSAVLVKEGERRAEASKSKPKDK